MKLIVMGAGYVGMALLNYLQKLPHEVFITTTDQKRVDILKPFGKQVLVLHPNEDQEFKKLIDASDGIVILVAPKNSQNYEETYLNTAKRILAALKDRIKPFYIVYTSSTSVCEGVDTEWVTEESTLNPKSENAKILLETERCYLTCGMQACILRLGGIFGPGRELTDRARRFSGKEMTGTGDEPTNHIHLDDIVKGIAFCLDHSLTGLYHLVNDDHRTRKELYSSLCEQMQIPPPIWNPTLSQNQKNGYKVSNLKIKETGLVPINNRDGKETNNNKQQQKTTITG